MKNSLQPLVRAFAFVTLLVCSQLTFAQFPPCNSGVLTVPTVQCIDAGGTASVSIVPGSELMAPNGRWYLYFSPVQGQSNASAGFSSHLPDTFAFPFVFDNTVNGLLPNQSATEMEGRWDMTFAVGYEFGVPCQESIHMIHLDFRTASVPCGTGTPLWIAAETQPATGSTCDGSVNVEVYSGTPPYTYTFSTGASGSSSELTGLCHGLYSVSVEDGTGQSISSTFFIPDYGNVYMDSLISSILNPDTLYTSPVLTCDLDFNLPLDSFYVETLISSGPDTLVAEWVVWQQGFPFTLIGAYPNNGNPTPVLSLTLICMDGRAQPGAFQLFAVAPELTLAVEETSPLSGTSVYPNPTEGELTIRLQEPMDDLTVKLSNVLGQTISSEELVSADLITIQLPSKSGLYLLTLTDANGYSITKRVVKE